MPKATPDYTTMSAGDIEALRLSTEEIHDLYTSGRLAHLSIVEIGELLRHAQQREQGPWWPSRRCTAGDGRVKPGHLITDALVVALLVAVALLLFGRPAHAH